MRKVFFIIILLSNLNAFGQKKNFIGNYSMPGNFKEMSDSLYGKLYFSTDSFILKYTLNQTDKNILKQLSGTWKIRTSVPRESYRKIEKNDLLGKKSVFIELKFNNGTTRYGAFSNAHLMESGGDIPFFIFEDDKSAYGYGG